MPLSVYVRFNHRAPHVNIAVDVHADGSVELTRFGRPYWRVRFESPGNRVSVAHVPASVILAAIRAAVEER